MTSDNNSLSRSASPDSTASEPERCRPSSCVFVASLASILPDDHLCRSVEEHFKKWGSIKVVKVLRDQVNRPYAFVQYTNDKDAETAIEQGQKTELDGRVIRCEPAKVNRTLFVTPVNVDKIEKSEVEKVLSTYGELEDVTLAKFSPAIRVPTESWFCRFAYREDAILAYASLRSHPDWHAEWTQNLDSYPDSSKETIDKSTVFMGRLNFHVTEKEIRDRMSKHGEIIECNLVAKEPFVTRGEALDYNRLSAFAFVKYADQQSAAKAIEEENHTIFMDRTIYVQYYELQHFKNRRILGPKLELAPPPVNLPSRFTTITALTPWRTTMVNMSRMSMGPPMGGPGFRGGRDSFSSNNSRPFGMMNSRSPSFDSVSSTRYSGRPGFGDMRGPPMRGGRGGGLGGPGGRGGRDGGPPMRGGRGGGIGGGPGGMRPGGPPTGNGRGGFDGGRGGRGGGAGGRGGRGGASAGGARGGGRGGRGGRP